MNFEEMESTADVEAGDDYDLDNFEEYSFPEDSSDTATVVGELLKVIEEMGQYDSTAYLLESEDSGKLLVWGNASINAGFENGDIEAGDTVGIRQTGETYENEYGEFPQYEVRFQKA